MISHQDVDKLSKAKLTKMIKPTTSTTWGASRWDQSISGAGRLVEFNHVLLETGTPRDSTGSQISANQQKDDGHIKHNDNLKTDKKKLFRGLIVFHSRLRQFLIKFQVPETKPT